MSYDDKNFVGMDCCPICNEPRGILLHRQLKNSLNKYNCTSPKPCDKCIKDLEEHNAFIVYECPDKNYNKPNFTGRWIKCNLTAFTFPEDTMNFIKNNRFMCATKEIFNYIINKAKERGENINENNT